MNNKLILKLKREIIFLKFAYNSKRRKQPYKLRINLLKSTFYYIPKLALLNQAKAQNNNYAILMSWYNIKVLL